MKIFQRYNPLQVAKYVKILFRGRLYIKDVGAFEFDKGKILIPKVKDKLHLSVKVLCSNKTAPDSGAVDVSGGYATLSSLSLASGSFGERAVALLSIRVTSSWSMR